MAELVMDNPFSQSASTTSKFAKPVQDLKDCVVKLKEDFLDLRLPLNDDNQDLHRFCAKLEYLLQAGLKAKTGLLGGKKDYWNYFCDCLGSNKSLNDGIQFVKSLNEVRSSLGRGRALIRFGLTHQRLADTLQQCLINKKITGEWYHPQSVWLNPVVSTDIVNALYDLNDIQFDLSSRGYDLDTSWPSFAKRPYGMGQNLQVPGRSTSINSLSSIPSSFPSQSVDPDTQSQVDLLEHEKLAAEHRSHELEGQLVSLQEEKTQMESANEKLKSKVTEADLFAKDMQMKNDGNDLLCEKLANELHLKETLWEEREQNFQERLDVSKKTIKTLEQSLEEAAKKAKENSAGPSPMDLVELKSKLRLSETTCKTLRIELDSAQKEVLARNKVNEAKDALISMQDKKLEQQKKQVDGFEAKLENYRLQNESRFKESEVEVRDLKMTLKQSERQCELLTRQNKDLDDILKTVHKKSGEIGQLAKEKLNKYKSENQELQAKVERLEEALKCQEDGKVEEHKEQLEKMTKEREELEAGVAELRSKLQEKQGLVEEREKTVESNKEEIKDLKELVESLKSQSGSQETELTERVMKTQEEHRALQEKNKDLMKNMEKYEKEAEMKQQDLIGQLDLSKSELEEKTKELEEMNIGFEEKLRLSEEKEREKEGERQVLLQQLESQREELELLKQELTGLGKVLSHATAVDEVDAANDLNKMVHSVVDKQTFLQESMESMKQRNDELNTTIKATELKLEETLHDLEKVKGDKEELETQLCSNEAALSDCQIQLQEKQVFVEELQESHNKLENQLNLLEARVEQCNTKEKGIMEESEMKDKVIAANKVQINTLKEKVSLLEELLEQTEGEKREMENEEVELRGELESIEGRRRELEETIEAERKSQAGLREELNEIKAANEQQVVELQRNVESVRQKENELVQTSENKASVEQELQEALTEKRLLQEKIDSLAKDLDSINTAARESSEADKQRISELEQGNNDLTQQNTSLSETIQKQERTSKEHMEDIQNLKEVKAKLSGKIDKLEEECDKLMQKVDHYQKENNILSDSVKSLEQDNAKHQQGKELLQAEVEALSKQVQNTSQLNEELLSTADQRSSLLSEKESKQAEMEKQVEARTCELQELEKRLNERQSEVESLNVKVSDLMKEKNDLSESMNASFFELKEKVGQYECENEALREEVQSIVGDKEKQFLTLAEEITKLKGASDVSAEELTKKEQECLELENKATELSQELEVFERTIQEKDTYIGELQEKSQKMEGEMDQLRSALGSEQGEMDKKLEAINDQVAKLQDTLKDREEEVERLQSTHQQEVQAVRFQLSTELMQLQGTVQDQKEKEKDVTTLTDRIGELEFLLEDSQTQLLEKKTELTSIKEKHQQQLADFEERLYERDREGQMMAEQLVRSNKVIEDDLQLVKSERKESHEKLNALRVKNSEMESENVELKKKIIELIKEKDSLWKKSDKLQYQKKMKASLVWENSDRATNCTACNTQFGFTLRKHHCRLCGQIFCYYCCNNWVMTSFSSKKERVCGSCLLQQSQLESASEGEDSGDENRKQEVDEEELENSQQLPALRSPMWKQRPQDQQDFPPPEDDATLVKARRNLAEDLDTLGDSPHQGDSLNLGLSPELGNSGSPTSLDQEKLLSMTDESKSGRLQQQAHDQAEDQARDASPRKDDEPYDLITSEEVQASLQEPVPDPDTEMAPMLTSESFKDCVSVEGPSELWIRPGKAYAAAVRIEEAGTTLKWEFTTYPKDINFGLVYRETEWSPFEDSDCLIPMCKCNSHKKAIDGELTARKPGIYTLIFDNKASRFTAKKLMYKLEETVQTT